MHEPKVKVEQDMASEEMAPSCHFEDNETLGDDSSIDYCRFCPGFSEE